MQSHPFIRYSRPQNLSGLGIDFSLPGLDDAMRTSIDHVWPYVEQKTDAMMAKYSALLKYSSPILAGLLVVGVLASAASIITISEYVKKKG